MKGFLVLLLLTAAGVAGVIYFRRYIEARHKPAAPVADATKDGKDRRRRRRHGARRLARNAASGIPARSLPGEAPAVEAAPGEAPPAPVGEAPPRVFDQPEERAPLAPGGSATTEVGPDDVFGPVGGTPTQSPSAARRQVVEEPPPVKLRPADLKIVWQGEDLSRADTQRLDFSNDSGGHELTDGEIDARFRTKEEAILACVARSRPSGDPDIPGRVTVKFRILPTGAVKGVQVEAPVILHKGGLTGCIKNVMGSLRFPKSGMGQVVSFPFSLM